MISLIIPIYNVEKYIEDTIVSVCNQSFRDFQVILVDNNTPDSSVIIAEKILAERGVRFKTVKQNKQGLAATRNMGFDTADGEWVVSIDSDDTISPKFLSELYTCAIENNLQYVTSKYAYVHDKNDIFNFPEEMKINSSFTLTQEDALNRYLLRQLPIMITNTLFKKSFLDDNNLRLDEEMMFGADLAFMWRVLIKVEKIGIIDKALYNYYNRPDSLMTAPSMAKIESRINGFIKLKNDLKAITGEKFANWILYREIIALFATLSQFGGYEYYIKAFKQYYNKEMFVSLLKFPDLKIKILNVTMAISPRLFNYINRAFRRKKNISKIFTNQRFKK